MTPRVATATQADCSAETWAVLQRFAQQTGGEVLNVLATVARHPDLFHAWLPFGNHVLGRSSTLPKRSRELVLLRTGYLARSGYEWAQHVAIARAVGCTDEDIERVVLGADAAGWSDADRALLEATDELIRDHSISSTVWSALTAHWSELQRIDLVFAIGQYLMVSMALNAFRVEIEEGVELFPAALFQSGHFAPHEHEDENIQQSEGS